MYDVAMAANFLTIDECGQALGVSRSTVWRLVQCGNLPTVRRARRRLVPATALKTRLRRQHGTHIPEFTDRHPVFRLVGAGRGGGAIPGARDKYAVLDEGPRSLESKHDSHAARRR